LFAKVTRLIQVKKKSQEDTPGKKGRGSPLRDEE